MSNKKLANQIIEGVGGKENINSLFHCATRLRFTLNNKQKANKEEVEKIDGVVKAVESQGLFMVVIGNNVSSVYDTIMEETGLQEEGTDKPEEESKGNFFDKFSQLISGIFSPVLGTLAGAGLLKGVVTLLVVSGLLSDKSGTFTVLNATADSFFYFLPLILAFTTANKFKVNPFLAVTLGGVLIHPSLVAIFTAGESLEFFDIPVILGKYSGTVIPIILGVWALSHVEGFFKKRLHESVRNLLTPFFSLIIMGPLLLLVVGPAATYISKLIASGYMSVYSLSPIISGIIIGALWQTLVIFGLHWGFTPISLNNLSIYGRDSLSAMIGPGVAGQTGATLGVFLKTKNKSMKRLSLSAFITGLFGITEPAIYGVTLKLKKPFIVGSIAGAVGGGIAGGFGASAIALATKSVLTFPIYAGGTVRGLLGYILGYFVSMILACILTYIVGFEEELDDEQKENQNDEKVKSNENLPVKQEKIASPIKGNIVALEEVNDPVFSGGAMGKGIAIIPDEGKLYAPVDGVLSMAFKTNHAYGFTTKDGAEILVHIGIDTVRLEGTGFKRYINEGEKVKKGSLVAEFDIEMIKNAGYEIVTPIIVTNTDKYLDVIPVSKEKEVKNGEDVLSLIV